MEYPLVSIITPSFNQAAFLEKTIQSVLNQDYPNLEYWVIDGGSQDGSVEIIRKYETQLAGWVSEKDQGQADAINKGLARATGEFVAWLNSDDLYYPNAIAEAVEALQKCTECAFVYSDVNSIDENDQVFNQMRYQDWGLTDLMRFRIIGQPSVFMRRQTLEQAGHLDTSYHYLLDHHLWLRLAVVSKPCYAQGAVWAAARMHAGAKNIAQAANFGVEARRLAEWLESDPRFGPISPALHRQIWAGAHRLDAFYLMEAGKPKDSLRQYWQSFRKHPVSALQDWRRIGFAVLSAAGCRNVRSAFDRQRRKRYQQTHKTR